nr:MAG TPA: hypothetical protein [Caudoviricetes sp.]
MALIRKNVIFQLVRRSLTSQTYLHRYVIV